MPPNAPKLKGQDARVAASPKVWDRAVSLESRRPRRLCVRTELRPRRGAAALQKSRHKEPCPCSDSLKFRGIRMPGVTLKQPFRGAKLLKFRSIRMPSSRKPAARGVTASSHRRSVSARLRLWTPATVHAVRYFCD